MAESRLFTSSAVLAGHPDKLCDRLSDALVDAYLTADPQARIRAEVAVAGQLVFVVTDAQTRAGVDVTGVAREVLAETGYAIEDLNPERCTILTQSSVMIPAWEQERPAGGLNDPEDAPAHEQTTVFGYACSETPERMPVPIRTAQLLAARLDRVAGGEEIPGLGPDGSVQVTVEYRDDLPARIDALVIQVQHKGDPERLKHALGREVIAPVFQALSVRPDAGTRLLINAEGPWLIGGPARNAGHTGRKQASDTYGGAARHGDGALSGKDPSRMDRSAAYAARHVANNVVASGLASECEVMLSYSIGQADPTTIFARTFGRGRLSNQRLSEVIREVFDLRPTAIARRFNLWLLPREHGGRFYRDLAVHGQVGRTDIELPWERLDAVDAITHAAGAAGTLDAGRV